jgi:hypothetical protein
MLLASTCVTTGQSPAPTGDAIEIKTALGRRHVEFVLAFKSSRLKDSRFPLVVAGFSRRGPYLTHIKDRSRNAG